MENTDAFAEMPPNDSGEGQGGFPPYPPYVTEPAPPSVADTILAGRDLRVQYKSTPRKTVRKPPKPARPRGPNASDVKMTRRAMRAHARCLQRHGVVLTDRMERISKPPRRTIIYLWRERADCLPAETIARLRSMLDADEPFKPDQAYEYFVNLRKTKKKVATTRGVNQIKHDMMAMYADKRFIWARNATVAFARGIQQRLSSPGSYALADGMLRLSNIVLKDICGHMNIRPPSRSCARPKAKFMMEMSDKIAVWIDEILTESDDRMLMMDFDEDEDVIGAEEQGDQGFADDFLNMMGDGGLLKGPKSAYLKFTGEMLEAFMILTDSMNKKSDEQLLSHGKFQQTYTEAADELKQAESFEATEFNSTLANKVKTDLDSTAKPNTPNNLAGAMKDVIEICSNYLAQYAEFNKDKGPAFKFLVKAMHAKGGAPLFAKGKASKTYTKAATQLEKARGLESDHDDPNLSQEIHSKLTQLVESQTPPNLKTDMTETIDKSSKYLSQSAIDEIERGPAFDLLISQLEKHGADPFAPQFTPVATKFPAAYVLKSAPGLSGVTPDPKTSPIFVEALHQAVDIVTPKTLLRDMNEVINRCANYLSAFVRDRDISLQTLLKMMKSKPKNELCKRDNYTMNYGTSAAEIETAPILVPFAPVKDVADDAKENITSDMQNVTPPELKLSIKALIQDVSRYLSQPFALRSGIAGKRYPLDLLAAVLKSLGSRPLFKFKAYGQTYADAGEVLKYAGPLESDPKAENLHQSILSEMHRGVPTRLSPSLIGDLGGTMDKASGHLAKIGAEKGETLQHLVDLMKAEGEASLGIIQGYQQSYTDGARRIENAASLTTEKVDKGGYESIRAKLTTLTENKGSSTYAKQLPGIVDEASKFLASPLPESNEEKRRLLADLMARKGDTILSQDGLYKITYTEGGKEIMNAPVGVKEVADKNAKQEMVGKLNGVIPDKKLQDLLNDPVNEGAAHLVDLIKGRGAALQVIHDGMVRENDKAFLTAGKFSKTYKQAGEMIETAPYFGGQHPSPILLDKVSDRIDKLPTTGASELAIQHLPDTSKLTSSYIAGVATKECGLDEKALAALHGGAAGRAGTGVGVGGVGARADASGAAVARGSVTAGGATSTTNLGSRPGDLDAERRRRAEDEERRRRGDFDPEREQAMQILKRTLQSRGAETFYKQSPTELTHVQASEWLSMKPPMKVDKSVKESGDTARLQKKFERKLSSLVSKVTSPDMTDTMQDVIIESSRTLSEYFLSKNYKALVRVALISEMQKRGNEILIEVDGAAETYFFAAQRLKLASTLEVAEPCFQVAYTLTKKLEDMIRCRSMARKLTVSMKDHIKDAADYLSAYVTKPDEKIEAYIALLNEMEAAGDSLLIEGDISKSYKDSAEYLRQLTTFQDEISQSNATLQSATEGKLNTLMSTIAPRGYNASVLSGVISESTKLLVSYIVLQGIKTEALKVLIEHMDKHGQNVLLRHGTLRKIYSDGADLLRPKNADQLRVLSADPVVARKIQIKLRYLMYSCTPDKYATLMDDVIEEATLYLAVYFLQPRVIQVCKCMKNVFVQCELWCDEILRRLARPCCTCSRHISVQALADLAGPGQQIIASSDGSRAYAPGLEITLSPCPNRPNLLTNQEKRPCPLGNFAPCKENTTHSYCLYSSAYHHRYPYSTNTEKLQSSTDSDRVQTQELMPSNLSVTPVLLDSATHYKWQPERQEPSRIPEQTESSSPTSFYTPPSTESNDHIAATPYSQSPITFFAKVNTQIESPSDYSTPTGIIESNTSSKGLAAEKRGYYTTRAPIVTTDQMADWHAMMVSLMWNVQAWRAWIQDNINQAVAYKSQGVNNLLGESWANFHRRLSTEALQWRQYNNFSRQLTLRLGLRYRDKKIVSPTRATVKTEIYIECQNEMLDIIDMFNRWTRWLTVVIKETDSIELLPSDSEMPASELRWNYFKTKVEEYLDDWNKYNTHLKVSWEQKYKPLISDWIPAAASWHQTGPVWVISACGAVPSGAVAAGVYEGEITWIARTTHRCSVLPAALHPSKHCCVVYSDGAVHHYTKYQVMCNAEVSWVACRANKLAGMSVVGGVSTVSARAVRVSHGVHVGRVLYRGSHLVGAVHAPMYCCHVVIFGRPFAFNCYELLVLGQDGR